jgi:hypothetical protein
MESKNGVESVGGGCHAKSHVERGEQQQDAISPRRVLSHELLEVATAGPHFTCFTGTMVQILTQSVVARVARGRYGRCSFYLLYWYKGTNNAQMALRQQLGSLADRIVSVCEIGGYTSTKVQILTHVLVQKHKY